MMRSRLLVWLALGIAVLLGHSTIHACSCAGTEPPCQAYWNSDVIFAGQVLGSGEISVSDDVSVAGSNFIGKRVVRFNVEGAYKGTRDSYIEVTTGWGGGDCGYEFEKGAHYLVYAYRDEKDRRLYTGICSRTRPLADATEDLEYFKNIPAKGTGATISGNVLVLSAPLKYKGGLLDVKPLSGIKITVVGKNPRAKTTTTDKDGNYRIEGLEPGKYKVSADIPASISEYSQREVEVVDRGCAGTEFRGSLNGVVSGKLTDAAGQPVAGIKVDLIPQDQAYSESPQGKWTFTRDDGTYQIDWLPPGKYIVGVNLIGSESSECPNRRVYYPSASEPSLAKIVTIGEGQKLKDLNVHLPPPAEEGTIEGTVFWPDGSLAVHAVVTLTNGTEPHYLIGKQQVVDDKGHFVRKAIVGCKYQVLAFTYGNRFGDTVEEMRHSEPVNVRVTSEPGQPLKLVLSAPGFQHSDGEKK